jgi:hypothetical protein
VRLEPGDEVRTVLILALGTNTLVVPKDTSGAFALAGMAEGEYHVRFLSTLSNYAPFDTILSVRSGRADTLPAPIRLRSTGIPAVTGLTARWDADAQAMVLAWDAADTAPATAATEAGYFQARVFVPEGGVRGRPGMDVSQGEIYWLASDRVNVYDSLGRLVRAFGNGGSEPLNNAIAIRISGDTVYVADLDDYNPDSAGLGSKDKFPKPKLRKFDRSGALIGTLDLGALTFPGLDWAVA